VGGGELQLRGRGAVDRRTLPIHQKRPIRGGPMGVWGQVKEKLSKKKKEGGKKRI